MDDATSQEYVTFEITVRGIELNSYEQLASLRSQLEELTREKLHPGGGDDDVSVRVTGAELRPILDRRRQQR